MSDDDLISVDEAAAILERTPRQVRYHIKKGVLKAIKKGWGDEPPGESRNTFRYRVRRKDVLDLKAQMPFPVGWPSHRRSVA